MIINKYIIYWAKLPNMTNPYNEGYIGVTKQKLKIRIKQHFSSSKNGSNYGFHKILREKNNIEWIVLGYAPNSIGAFTIEKAFRTNIKGTWNSTSGGAGWIDQTDEIKNKKSKSLKEFYNKEENKGRNKYFLGKKHTEETKTKIREKLIGKSYITEEGKETLSQKNRNKDIHTFFNKEYGFEVCNKIDLCKKYNLEPSNIRHVIAGRRASHKGWTLAKKVD